MRNAKVNKQLWLIDSCEREKESRRLKAVFNATVAEWRTFRPAPAFLLVLHQPNITILHGITMILKKDWSRRTRISLHSRSRVVHRDLDVIMNFDAVVIYGYPGW